MDTDFQGSGISRNGGVGVGGWGWGVGGGGGGGVGGGGGGGGWVGGGAGGDILKDVFMVSHAVWKTWLEVLSRQKTRS